MKWNMLEFLTFLLIEVGLIKGMSASKMEAETTKSNTNYYSVKAETPLRTTV